jgi:hypothetical protein
MEMMVRFFFERVLRGPDGFYLYAQNSPGKWRQWKWRREWWDPYEWCDYCERFRATDDQSEQGDDFEKGVYSHFKLETSSVGSRPL